ncbi:MAG: 2,3-diphosphoglycerate-dependent phosphoglycerate mutase [Candidatus Saccharibacteria bacterium]|nr:2,3-diphosphoglycerate-dependent phosphoglycerate mutase [Candidatus Saccharibacteria bacterium]
MSGKLVLIRHGESEWNLQGRWTGWTDVSITDKGAADAKKMGELLKDIHFDEIYTSKLKRTVETLENVLETQGQPLEYQQAVELNERDYGDYTGMNKWEVKDKVGEEKFNAIRRNYDEVIPNGENLHMVYDRVVPWYQAMIVPKLLAGENILLVAHGNSIRALIKYIESISDDDIAHVEFVFGTIAEYEVDEQGKMTNKVIKRTQITETKA